MEGDTIVGISENSAANLKAMKERQQVQQEFSYNRSNVISRAQLQQDRARHRRWLMEASASSEKRSSLDDFLMEMTAIKAPYCFEDPEAKAAEEHAKKEQARVIALNEARGKEREEERLSSEYHHHPARRMDLFINNAPSMCMTEQLSVATNCQNDFESLPSGSASVVNELVRMENEKDTALMRADDVAETNNEGNPFTQRANVFERMWVLVSDENPIWKLCCSVFSELREEAKNNHRQIAACKNCATVFVPFFPDDYHMHQSSSRFKSCVDVRSAHRSAEGDCESLPQRALVGLAQEAKAYMKEGGEEYIKLIRMVRGTRSNRGTVKYDRFELCENSNVDCCESSSKNNFESRNLTVGVLKLVIQLHLIMPIPSTFLKPTHHGAGFADYFQRYRHLVPEFGDETFFRCFLIEFGQYVRRTIKFDPEFKFNSNWWSGPSVSTKSTFVGASVLVKLDKPGMIQLAKSLVEGTFRVLDDFNHEKRHGNFLNRLTVGEEVELQDYLEQTPPEVEKEKIEKERLPTLQPLKVIVNPEVRGIEKGKKVSSSKLAKRPPDIDEKKLKRLEQLRVAKQRSRKKAAGGKLL